MSPTPTKKASARVKAQTLAIAQSNLEPTTLISAKSSNIAVYAVTILLSAFLLFQVQLVTGKFVLPRFGGAPSVWSTSLLVFQLLLLGGYGYAAVICKKFSSSQQAKIHLSLLAGSAIIIAFLAVLWHSPILPAASWKPHNASNPIWQIALLLSTAVGFHCVLLSATSPLLQKWFSTRNHVATPYRLYALSNLGSMLGLLTYPFLVERILTLPIQAWVWAAGYLIFLITAGLCAFLQMRHTVTAVGVPGPKRKKKAESAPRLLWLALAACASMMLLATTNLICQEVAVIPLLWVLPLSIYLLSFIICFDHARWYRREIFHPLYVVLALLSLRMLPNYVDLTIIQPLLTFCSTLLAVCMVCHGELARIKPQSQHLTSFYLMTSTGGAIGSAFVVLLAPHIFDRFWEFQIALLGCGVLLGITLVQDKNSWLYQLHHARIMLAMGVVLMAVGAYYLTGQLRQREGEGDFVVWRARNFFGVKTVVRLESGLFLLHGRTLHGSQNSDPATRNEPTNYYRRESGVGLLLDHYPRPSNHASLRVGVIGMGAGTLAAYGERGDYFRFYEIDPAMAGLSQGSTPLFTFVQASQARTEVVLGDARVSMQDEVSRGDRQKFDVLVVDAFSGDAVPVHLLTREAIDLYLQQLRGPQSVIAFHLTNRSLDLRPVVSALSHDYNMASIEVHPAEVGDWVLVSASPDILRLPAIVNAGHPVEVFHAVKTWTDDYSNLYEILRAW